MGYPRRSFGVADAVCRGGVPSGPFLVLPLLGPSTLRDAGARAALSAALAQALGSDAYLAWSGSDAFVGYAQLYREFERIGLATGRDQGHGQRGMSRHGPGGARGVGDSRPGTDTSSPKAADDIGQHCRSPPCRWAQPVMPIQSPSGRSGVLGVCAFGAQLLCEQLIGRTLRRVSYDPAGQDEQGNGMFEAEYADVLGIPFSFVPTNSAADYKPPKPTTRVHAVLPPGRLRASFTPESRPQITPDMAPPDTINAPFVGENIKLSVEELAETRPATVAFHLAGYTLERWFKDQEGNRKPWLFPSLLAITRRWIEECLTCVGGTSRPIRCGATWATRRPSASTAPA